MLIDLDTKITNFRLNDNALDKFYSNAIQLIFSQL